MKTVSGKRMCEILKRHGWTLDRTRGSHYLFSRPGEPMILVPVHANRDLPTGTQRTIMRQAGLTDADL